MKNKALITFLLLLITALLIFFFKYKPSLDAQPLPVLTSEVLDSNEEIEPSSQPTAEVLDSNEEIEPSSQPVTNGLNSTRTVSTNIDNLVIIFSVIILLTLICLLVVTTLLLRHVRWRKRISNNESIIFPDAHLDVLGRLKNAWESLFQQIHDYSNLTLSLQKQNESSSAETIDLISKFNTVIDEQKKEIDRLKEGYDFSIKKHFISPLIEIKELLETFLNENPSKETQDKLKSVNGYVDAYLEELDVEKFFIESGKSIRDCSNDEYKIDKAEIISDESLHEKVKETASGYAFVHPNGRIIISKAKIIMYKKELDNG
jgi:hypothetical protein